MSPKLTLTSLFAALLISVSFPVYANCNIACYSHKSSLSRWPVGDGIYTQGEVAVDGSYDQWGICRPAGYEAADISKEEHFMILCAAKVPNCNKGDCWAGGETGHSTMLEDEGGEWSDWDDFRSTYLRRYNSEDDWHDF